MERRLGGQQDPSSWGQHSRQLVDRADRRRPARSCSEAHQLAGPGRQTDDSLLAVQVCVLGPAVHPLGSGGEHLNLGTQLVTATNGHRTVTASQIASRQGMGSLDGSCGIERDADPRLRWSEAVWSSPPESNRRPHPYHGTTGNRCAERHLRRSRSTVRAEVIGSLSPKVCVLLPILAIAALTPIIVSCNDLLQV